MMVKFIAEVSSNHNADLNRCLQFIQTAADIGCDAIKFQLFKVKELFADEILKKSPKHRMRKQWELPVSFLPALYSQCKANNIEFCCTPFYLDAIDELNPFVDFFKISSYELLWDSLLTACAQTKKPIILSTGMSTMEEIEHAVSVISENKCTDLTVLHCVSSYPVELKECNLAAIHTMRKKFDQKNLPMAMHYGWSDHSVQPAVLFRAVHRWQAEVVEFHLDIDGCGKEFQAGHCWLPDKIKDTISLIKQGFPADGKGLKEPSESESEDVPWRADPIDGLRPFQHVRKTFR